MSGRTGERGNGETGSDFPVPPFSRSPVPPSTLVVQTAFLGDVILTLPLLIRLAERHGPVDVVTTPLAAPLLRDHPAVRQVIPFDKRGHDRGLAGLRRVAAAIKQRDYARAYLPHRSLRTAMLVRLAGIPERIGFGGQLASVRNTRRIAWPETGHITERLLTLLDDVDSLPPRPWIELTAEDHLAASTWMSQHGVNDRFVALAPGSRWGTKRWPGYPQLAADLGQQIVVIGDAADRPLGEAIVAATGARAVNACGDLTLRQSAALIARSARLITNDSAPLHLATALDHPVTVIFGPTVPAFGFGPIGPGGTIVEHPDMPCRPCSSHGPMTCPLGHHRCMTELGAAAVRSRM